MTSTADVVGNSDAPAVLCSALAGERGEHPRWLATSTAPPPLNNENMNETLSTRTPAEFTQEERRKRKSGSTTSSLAKRASLAKDIDIQPHLLKLLPTPGAPGIFSDDVSKLYDKIPREGNQPLPTKSPMQIRIALRHMVDGGVAHREQALGPNGGKTFRYWQEACPRNGKFRPVIETTAGAPPSTNGHLDSHTGQQDDARHSSSLRSQPPDLLWHSQTPLPGVAALKAAVQWASDERYDPTESSVNLINTNSNVGEIDGGPTENAQAQENANYLRLLKTARRHRAKLVNVGQELLELKVQMERADRRGVELERQMKKEEIDKEEWAERVRRLQEELRQAEAMLTERGERVIKLQKETADNRRDQETWAADVAHKEKTLAEVEIESQKVKDELGV